MADFKLSANIEVRKQAPLDDRLAKLTKADLIKPESWASDNGTYYVYDYMLVGTSDGLFMLVDKTKILNSDYSGWKRIGSDDIPTGGLSEGEVKDLIGQALSIALADYVEKIDGKGLSTNDYTNEDKTKLDGLSNYDDTTIKEQIQGLQNSLNTLVGGNASSAIESFNEIVAFLASIEDTQTLGAIINGINQAIAEVEAKIPTVPTKISELENDSGFITSEAIPDLSEYAKKSDIPTDYIKQIPSEYITDTELEEQLSDAIEEIDGKIPTKTSQLENDSNFLTEHQNLEHLATKDEVKSKQDAISDLSDIREGAAKGATALQSIPDEYVTTSELDDKIKELGFTKNDLLAIEISEVGEVSVTYGEKSDFVGGQIRETGELVLEFNIE